MVAVASARYRPGAGEPRTPDLSGRVAARISLSSALAVNDIVASVGSKGASYDALVESFNGLYK